MEEELMAVSRGDAFEKAAISALLRHPGEVNARLGVRSSC